MSMFDHLVDTIFCITLMILIKGLLRDICDVYTSKITVRYSR